MVFLDFKQAYDGDKEMEDFGVQSKLIYTVKMILNDTERVLGEGKTIDKFMVKARLKQGDPLSMCLFCSVLEESIREVKIKRSRTICGISFYFSSRFIKS